MMGSVSLCTYNCNSFRNNRFIIEELMLSNDIILLQELMLLSEDVHLVKALSTDWDSIVTVKDRSKEGILEGRPSKGVAILWKKNLTKFIRPIYHDDRIIGITIDSGEACILLLNVYLPYYDKSNFSISEYLNTLSLIETIYKDIKCNSLIIMGDFNSNIDNSHFGELLKKFITNNNLCCLDKILSPDSFTFLSPSHNSISWLDHIICSNNLVSKFNNVAILYDLCAYDHFPVSCNFNLDYDLKISSYMEVDEKFVIWSKLSGSDLRKYKANIDTYCNELTDIFHNIFNCNVYNCNIDDHRNKLSEFYNLLVNILHKSCSEFVITKLKNNKKNCIPGWNKYVKPYFEDAKLKFRIWKDSDRTHNDKFHEMKIARSKFRSALKSCKNNEERIRNELLVSSHKNKNMSDFWNHVRNHQNGNLTSIPFSINNKTDDIEIVDEFSQFYKSTLHDDTYESINKSPVQPVDWHDIFLLINSTEIKETIFSLKPSLGPDFIHLYHLKNGTDKLFNLLAKFLNSCLMHNFIPDSILKGVIKPIIKNDKGDLNDLSNYRPVMSSSIFLKILEHFILKRLKLFVNINDRQHGFRANHSTSSAILILKETISAYLNKNSDLFTSFLDLSKAFDKVNHKILFDKLINLQLPNYLVNIIVYIYENQSACVKHKESFSDSWSIDFGVRQGGILSPLLFSIYINDLIEKISKSKIGAKLGLFYSNIICYADDIVLLSPSIPGLQILLDMIDEELLNLKLSINVKKSVILRFLSNASKNGCNYKPKLFVSGIELTVVDKMKYLGVIINSNFNENDDIYRLRNNFFNKFNMILRKFNSLDVNAFMTLFKSYCMQFYGAELWLNFNNSSQVLKQFEIGFHKSLKKILNVSYHESNHAVCKHLKLLTLRHYLNYLQLTKLFSLLQNPCNFINKNKFFYWKGVFLNKLSTTFKNVYGISDVFNNDLDALIARIYFIFNLEDSLR